MKTEYTIERSDIQKKFGQAEVEEVAAALYAAFHGECRCTSHPFEWDDCGDFHGYVPWHRDHPEKSDTVVQAFRLAALAAYETLRGTGIGSLK